jgi:membrane-associated PAP2 superfamily phosphatase
MALQLQSPLRSYLNLRRTRAILGSFLAISLLLVVFSGIDLHVSRLFFDHGFYMANQGWTMFLHASVSWFIYGSVATVAAIYAFNRLSRRNRWGIDGKTVVYLLVVLALGAGIVVNGILKDGFGRRRRRAVITAAVGFGLLVSAARIASGSHFLSDTVVSFFLMLIISDALYYRMFLFRPDPAVLVPAPAPVPAPGAAVMISTAEKPSTSP